MIRILLLLGLLPAMQLRAAVPSRPNILFFFVDDWGRDAGIYADPNRPTPSDIIKTPNFDRIGREGVVFNHAFVLVSSCGPSRASLATGRHFWNCGSGAFLNGAASDWILQRTKDPRLTDQFDRPPYVVDPAARAPSAKKRAKKWTATARFPGKPLCARSMKANPSALNVRRSLPPLL